VLYLITDKMRTFLNVKYSDRWICGLDHRTSPSRRRNSKFDEIERTR